MTKTLQVKNSILDKQNLKKHLEQFSADNKILKNPNKDTFPIERLKENKDYIDLVCKLLGEHLKLNITIHPAGEWLLDNYYLIEKSVKVIQKNLTYNKYMKLPSIENGGFARIYEIANEIISGTDANITENDIIEYMQAYQVQKKLYMQEIWDIGLFLQICIIEKIRKISEKIFETQMQRYKAQNIVNRFVEKKSEKKINIDVNSKYSFIEYLSYKLRQYGKISIPYIEALDGEIRKAGMTLDDIISREHFDIALKTLSMKNSITSLKNIERLNIVKIFENTSEVEKILKKDPSQIYEKMDFSTKEYYRNAVLEIAKKTKTSEIYVAQKAIDICNEIKNQNQENENTILEKESTIKLENKKISDIEIKQYNYNKDLTNYKEINKKANKYNKQNQQKEIKKSHIGYYLIDQGQKDLIQKLTNKKYINLTYQEKAKIYVYTIIIASILVTMILGIWLKWTSILLFIPIKNIITKIFQYNISKIQKTKILPKMDYQENIPETARTMCIFPTILKNEKEVQEMVKKMEEYYISNKSENILFTLLGDCTKNNTQKSENDENIKKAGISLTNQLNQKYGNKFFFVYRKREWNNSEKCFMGWERKRGYINQFNDFLLGRKVPFDINTCKDFLEKSNQKTLNIKYVITLDSDTNLTLNSAFKLIGTIDHILNKPEIDKIKNVVICGHGIIQPRIGIDIESGRKNTFSKIFAGSVGTDVYANAVSDIYQDSFDEGTFTGKGIYDLKVFDEILRNTIPENKILSHDLIEGSYLRCGLASDIVLMDEAPTNYLSYKIRKERWSRGDTQALPWIKSQLNFISKYKIKDNISRNLNTVFILASYITLLLTSSKYVIIPLLLLTYKTIIDIFDNFIIEAKGKIKSKTFVKTYSKLETSIMQTFIEFIILIDTAYLEIKAFIKAIYRMNISHNFLLEWTTAKEAEKINQNSIISYYKNMKIQIILSIILIAITSTITKYSNIQKILLILVDTLWLIAPKIMYKISQNKINPKIEKNDEKYLIEIAKKTWNYFKENQINNLPADNYQEDRKEKIAKRTSPTNIGLSLLSAISSYDLKIETLESTLHFIKKEIDTIEKLKKWNGHLYNWYNIKTLEPLPPYDISSVDSGNFIGDLYTLKAFLQEVLEKNKENTINLEEKQNIIKLIEKIEKIIKNTNFKKLYNEEIGLFSIGYSTSKDKLYDSYYDLLASEARQTSIIAIAKRDVPQKHWANLGRTLTNVKKYNGLISWGGTTFEYLMPNIIIPTYENTLIDESCRLLIYSNIQYAQKLGIPWGISESAYSVKDLYGNYQYKTFGLPWLGLKRGLENDLVISPYSTALSLQNNFKEGIENLKKLEKEKLIGKYGFYDSIDYKPSKQIVKTFMAHHEGMILTSIDNSLKNNIFQKRFMSNPEIKGTKILLEENMPQDEIITKEKKDKVKKIKYNGYKEEAPRTKGYNVIAKNEISNITNENGEETTKFEDIIISNNLQIFIKNAETNQIYDINEKLNTNPPNYNIQREFTPYSTKFNIENKETKYIVETTIAPDADVIIKKIQIKNNSKKDINFEITTYENIILSNIEQYNSHPAFDKMFLKFSYENNKILVERKQRMENEKCLFTAKALYMEQGKFEYEVDKEKIIKRENIKSNIIPTESIYEENSTIVNTQNLKNNKITNKNTDENNKLKKENTQIINLKEIIKNSPQFSNKIENTPNPILAMRRQVKIPKDEKIQIYYITSIGKSKEEVIENINKYMNTEKLSRVFELEKNQTKAQIRYLDLTEKEISKYQQNLTQIFRTNQEVFDNNLQNYIKNDIKLDTNKKNDVQESVKSEYNKLFSKMNLSNNELWKFGISGDYPIILLEINNQNNIFYLKKLLKEYEYYKTINVQVELVIITKLNIIDELISQKMGKYLNVRSGIFVINNIGIKEKKEIEMRACKIISPE